MASPMKTTSRTLRAVVALLVSASAAVACSRDATAPIAPVASNSSSLDSSAAGGTGYYGTARSAARIRLIATLAPSAGGSFGRASGKAKWGSRNNNSQRELEMEVEDVAAGTQVQFFVSGVRYGSTVTVDALGNARIELSTQLGQRVPTAAAGATAEVRTTGGSVVVRGVFPTS